MLNLKNKKGDATSLIISLLVLIFAIAVISLMSSKFIPQMMDIIKNQTEISQNNNSVEVLNMVQEKTPHFLDYFFIFTFVATIIGLIISSIYIDTHPAMMIAFIIVLVIAIIFAGIFANAYTTIGETAVMSSTYNQLTSTKAIFDNLPLILFVVGLIIIIVLYGKARTSSSGGAV
jgi:hypothetical protein